MSGQERSFSNEDVHVAWETNAAWWDSVYKEGNAYHRILLEPATERLLGIRPGEKVLDVACGNGCFSRHLADLGARVVAFDFSSTFLDCAKVRTTENADRIEYRRADATSRDDLLSLGEGRFDAAVCTMALMDILELEPLAETLPRLLKPGGRFVFSVMHPCFNNNGCRMSIEEEADGADFRLVPGVRVTKYMTPFSSAGIGIRGQPVPHVYFHRPISLLLQVFFRHGLVVDGMEEQAFDGKTPGDRPVSWDSLPEIPSALVVRLRRAS